MRFLVRGGVGRVERLRIALSFGTKPFGSVPGAANIGHEERVATVTAEIGLTQDVGRMQGRKGDSGVPAREVLSALLRDLEVRADEVFGTRGSHAEDHIRLESGQLRDEPFTTGGDFGGQRSAVARLAGGPVRGSAFDGIGDVDTVAAHFGFGQGLVEELARAPDERSPCPVFLFARAFSHQDQWAQRIAFAEDDVGAAGMERALDARMGIGSEQCERVEAVLIGHGALSEVRTAATASRAATRVAYVSGKSCGTTRTSAMVVMKLASPFQRGTTCQWMC